MGWYEEAKKKKDELNAVGLEYNYMQIANDYGVHYDTVRKKFKSEQPKVIDTGDVAEEITKLLFKGTSISAITERLGLSSFKVRDTLKELKDRGFQIIETGERVKIAKLILPETNKVLLDWKGNKVFKYGVISDTHMGSKSQQQTFLNYLYDRFAFEGIKSVLHAGDITEGYGMRKGHEYEVFLHGADEFIQYVIDTYPFRDDMETYFITGNHDHSFIKSAGLNIGNIIGKSREDMKYLGANVARFYPTPNCPILLNHGLDGSCFDDQTEILTKDNGWVKFSELTKDDYVATMTKDTNIFEWDMPSEITIQDYKGDMLHFKARLLNLMVTPNHGMWTRENPIKNNCKESLVMPSKSHIRKDYKWRRETAEYIEQNYYRQKWQLTNICNEWKGKLIEYIDVPYIESKNIGMKNKMQHIGKVPIKDVCELVAWFVTEGYADCKRVCICQDNIVNPDNHKMIVELLDRLSLRYSIGGKNDKNITISSLELSHYLTSICGNGSYNKYLPEFIKELPIELLQVVIDVMIRGDGWVNGKAFGYKSVSKKLRNDFMEIAIKCGYGVCEKNDTVHLTKIQTMPTINNKPERVHYDGKVYCCKVTNGLILVRREGKATWSHNSYALSYTLQKTLDAMEGQALPAIFLNGHHHKAINLMYRGIHSLECFLANTRIETINGARRIKDIKVGDFVLTHNNRYREVVKTFSKLYNEEFVRINFGRDVDCHCSITSTLNHPLLINRKGVRMWCSASEVSTEDKIYIRTKKCKHCGSLIPYYRESCNNCITTRKKRMQDSTQYKNNGGDEHYKNDILPRALELKALGYQVFPIGKVVPDIVAVIDGKLVAIELEDRYIKHGKKKKYDNFDFPDEVRWEIINKGKPLGEYYIDAELELCYANITAINLVKQPKPRTVYNLTVDEDNSYVAANVVVHNCATTQAQTPWMIGKRLPAHVAGWIMEITVDDDGFVTEFGTKLLPCKNILEKDY